MKRIDSNEIKPRLNALLKELKAVCDEHGLRYYLWGGTLLGAGLYKGFIPWDDDIDIGMPRADYNKLIELQRAGKLKNTMHCNELNKKYKYMFAKYCDDKTLVVERYSSAGKFGLYVDIFPIDGIGKTREEARKLQKKLKWWTYFYWGSIAPWRLRGWIFMPPLILACPILLVWKLYYKKIDKMCKRYSFDDVPFIGIPACGAVGERQILLKEYYKEIIQLPFEDGMYPAPVMYKEWLDHHYSPRWIIPQPEEERVVHNYKAYEL